MEKNGILQPSGCTSSSYWFAMRATYGRNIKAKSILEEKGIEVFVPMQYTIVVRNGKRKKLLMPVIKDLIFVHTTKASIQSAKADIPFLYYITRPSQGKNIPLIVPDYQMKCFCDIASSDNDDVLFLATTLQSYFLHITKQFHGIVYSEFAVEVVPVGFHCPWRYVQLICYLFVKHSLGTHPGNFQLSRC